MNRQMVVVFNDLLGQLVVSSLIHLLLKSSFPFITQQVKIVV